MGVSVRVVSSGLTVDFVELEAQGASHLANGSPHHSTTIETTRPSGSVGLAFILSQTMSASVINALRRRLPMTKVKFNWDNMASVHKLATELNAVKTQ